MKQRKFIAKPYRSAERPALKWQVVGYANGKRTRRFTNDDRSPFTKAQAEQYEHQKNLELQRDGTEAAKLSPYDREIAGRALAELAPYGVKLQDLVRAEIERQEARQRSSAIEAVIAQYLELRFLLKWKRHHFLGLRRFFGRFAKKFPGKLMSDFTTVELEAFLSEIGPIWSTRSRNQHRTKFTALWTYGEKHGYCSERVARNIERLKEEETKIGTLRPAQLARLISVGSPKVVVGYAIGAWAGLRIEEICRLDWSQIKLRDKPDPRTGGYGSIRVLPENAKTARNRYVTIEENLAAWLRPFVRATGRVVVPNASAYFDELRQIDQEKAGITEWPNNALRHSYASYHYAHFGDLEKLISQMGHTGPRQIFKHYRELVTPEEANEYWTIKPSSRPDVTRIHAFTPEAYAWWRRVGCVVEGEWIDGVKNLAHYFGAEYSLPYRWFNHVQDCPPRPLDDRFHVPTWCEFTARHPAWKSNGHHCDRPYYVSWWCGDRSGEQRAYFATAEEAIKKADADNRRLLDKEVRLDEVKNVIEFTTNSISTRTFQSQPPRRTSEIADIAG